MMIEYQTGNILEATRGFLVHGCNSHGVMGAGIAKQIRDKYPECFLVYREEYQAKLSLGKKMTLGSNTYFKAGSELIIVNAITQASYGFSGNHLDLEALGKCFSKVAAAQDLLKKLTGNDLPIIFPKIGAGLAGGDWNAISKVIDLVVPDTIKKICYVLQENSGYI
jgi:O-acetyl-ADP-ribose deacetylase (regulator of RNase III)